MEIIEAQAIDIPVMEYRYGVLRGFPEPSFFIKYPCMAKVKNNSIIVRMLSAYRVAAVKSFKLFMQLKNNSEFTMRIEKSIVYENIFLI